MINLQITDVWSAQGKKKIGRDAAGAVHYDCGVFVQQNTRKVKCTGGTFNLAHAKTPSRKAGKRNLLSAEQAGEWTRRRERILRKVLSLIPI